MLGLKSHVNIQTILRLDRIQEIRQNVEKQNKNSEYKNKQKQIQTECRFVTELQCNNALQMICMHQICCGTQGDALRVVIKRGTGVLTSDCRPQCSERKFGVQRGPQLAHQPHFQPQLGIQVLPSRKPTPAEL